MSSLMDPRTVGQIKAAAESQVSGEISGQTIPLTSNAPAGARNGGMRPLSPSGTVYRF